MQFVLRENIKLEPNEVIYTSMKVAKVNEEVYGSFDCVEKLMEKLNA